MLTAELNAMGESPGCSPAGTLSHDVTAGSPEESRRAGRRMRAEVAFFFIVRIICLLLLLAVAVLQFVRLHWGRESVESGCPAALCGTFRLSTPSEGVGFRAVFATPSEGVRGGCACIGDATRAHYTGTEPGRQWLTHAVNELGLGTGRGRSTPPGRSL